MIKIKELTKKFGDKKVLDKVSFSVGRGEIVGFLGPNGAGKTTTMKIITGFLSPTRGKVLVDGLDVTENSLKIRKKIGYLAEDNPLYEDMKVEEFLKFIGSLKGLKGHKLKEEIKRVEKACGIREVRRSLISELSKGYRQRVGLAQALLGSPDILILDEPTSGLDPNQIIEIRNLIKKIGQEKTVLFSSHILGEVQEVCRRIVIIHKGRIVGEGTAEELARGQEKKIVYYLKVEGDRDGVLKRLKKIEGVQKAKIKDKEKEGVYGYKVEVTKDLRKEIFQKITDKGWVILEFSEKKHDLEDIFKELTSK